MNDSWYIPPLHPLWEVAEAPVGSLRWLAGWNGIVGEAAVSVTLGLLAPQADWSAAVVTDVPASVDLRSQRLNAVMALTQSLMAPNVRAQLSAARIVDLASADDWELRSIMIDSIEHEAEVLALDEKHLAAALLVDDLGVSVAVAKRASLPRIQLLAGEYLVDPRARQTASAIEGQYVHLDSLR